METVTRPWTCPTCNVAVSTPYCPACGEHSQGTSDLTLRGLLHQVFHALTDIDSRLIRSLRWLMTRPGQLTAAYVRGQRKPYIEPFPLFLITNVVFFAVQSLAHTNIFSSTLDSHLYHQDWNIFAQPLVAHHLEKMHTTLDLYAPIFNRAVVLNAKSLIILMVLPFALLLPVAFRRAGQSFVGHVVFSLHFYSFLLLLFCVSIGIAATNELFGGGGLDSPGVDNVLSLFNLAVCTTYLYIATGTVYGAKGLPRVIKAVALTLAAAGIMLAYRFALFLITLYST